MSSHREEETESRSNSLTVMKPVKLGINSIQSLGIFFYPKAHAIYHQIMKLLHSSRSEFITSFSFKWIDTPMKLSSHKRRGFISMLKICIFWTVGSKFLRSTYLSPVWTTREAPRILEWVAILFSRGSFWPRDWTWVSCILGRFSTIWVTREAYPSPGISFL